MTLQTNTDERAVFTMLWDMVNAIDMDGGKAIGSIISRYANMIDDRINNSGFSRSVDSLKLYTYDQLQEELDSRDEATPEEGESNHHG